VAKTSGLTDNLLVGGYDLSGDVGSLEKIAGGIATIDVTGINKSAYERLGGQRDGGIDFTAFWNVSAAQAHAVLSTLPTADVYLQYLRGTTLGNPAACLIAKQIDYAPTRASSGELTAKISAASNAYGIEWGEQLTAGLRTDTAATNGTGIDGTASSSFSWQAYLQSTALTGTSCTVTIQDSADNAAWANVTSGAFTAFTGPGAQRLAGAGGAILRRYVRAITTGTFTVATFSCVIVRNGSTTVF
jgi:hypothetical protein